jgi:hypothetical protein
MDVATETITIIVKDLNRPPVMDSIGHMVVDEGMWLSFDVHASDPDGDPITYYSGNLPAGATIDPVTGRFSWTPTTDQAGSYPVIFSALAGMDMAAETITITVKDLEYPPVLNSIGDMVVDEGMWLYFDVHASDPAGDPIMYYSDNLPAGATIDPLTGRFSWTPRADQVGPNQVRLLVSDGKTVVTETITIMVKDLNDPPVLDSLGNMVVDEGMWLSFDLYGSDRDGDRITYSADGLPEGATFDPGTGRFSWIPVADQVGPHQIQFSVTDGMQTASETITITVIDL